MTERPIRAWLKDAQEYVQAASEIAKRATAPVFDLRDRMAIRYCLMVVGEALNSVPTHVLDGEPQIPWAQIIALRHRLVHGYWLIDDAILREILKIEVEPLIYALERLVRRTT